MEHCLIVLTRQHCYNCKAILANPNSSTSWNFDETLDATGSLHETFGLTKTRALVEDFSKMTSLRPNSADRSATSCWDLLRSVEICEFSHVGAWSLWQTQVPEYGVEWCQRSISPFEARATVWDDASPWTSQKVMVSQIDGRWFLLFHPWCLLLSLPHRLVAEPEFQVIREPSRSEPSMVNNANASHANQIP